MKEIQQLRKLAVKLETSGSAIPLNETRLYKGGFGFVILQVYVPATQNRSSGTSPLCTVYRITTDAFGNRKQFNNDIYNLLYIDDVEIDCKKYMLFERPLPKAFTETVGDLEIVFNYSEIDGNVVVSRLASSVYRTIVAEGGVSNGETVDPLGAELARLNDLNVKLEYLEDSVDALLQQPDCDEADRVGTPHVELTDDGRLKFSELRGADALSLQAVIHTNIEPANGINFEATLAQFNREPIVGESVVAYLECNGYTYLTRANVYQVTENICRLAISGTPVLITGRKGDEGTAATVRVGEVTSLPFGKEATVENIGTENAAVFNFGIPKGEGFKIEKVYTSVSEMENDFSNFDLVEGDFVIINTGSVEDEDNAKLYAKGKTSWVFVTDMSGMSGKDGLNGSRIYMAQSGDVNLSGSWTAYLTQDDYEACIPGDVVVGKNGVMGNILNKYPTNVVAGLNGVNLKGEAAGSGYDLIITSQAEFEEWYATLDAGTCEAHSVLLVGDGGTFAFTREGLGLHLPETLYVLDGINNAKIKIANFEWDRENNKAAIWYTSLQTDNLHSMNNLSVECEKGKYYYHADFYNCSNISNCVAISGGFETCYYLVGCKGKFVQCSFVSNCSGEFANSYNLLNCNASKFSSCYYLSNCKVEISENASGVLFSSCGRLTNCYGKAKGGNVTIFASCFELTNCIGEIESTYQGFTKTYESCSRISNCRGTNKTTCDGTISGNVNSIAFYLCKQLVNCVGQGSGIMNAPVGGTIINEGCGYGFRQCEQLTGCVGTGIGSGATQNIKKGYGFYDCKYSSCCKSGDTVSTTSIWGGTNTKRDDNSCEI